MILSRKYNFIFIHIPKTAGLSIAQALSEYDESPKRTTKSRILRRLNIRSSLDTAYFKQHDSARAIAGLMASGDFDKLVSFAVVRNPFDHAVSHYEYMKQHPSKYSVIAQELPFEDYLAYRFRRPWYVTQKTSGNLWFSKLPAQNYFVTNQDGELMIDHFIRLENLNSELPKLLGNFGIDYIEVPKVNQSRFRQRDMTLPDYYSEKASELVRKIYARDFALFGYDPDPSSVA